MKILKSLCFALVLPLLGCADHPAPPPVTIIQQCNPPPELLEKAQQLAQIQGHSLTLQDIFKYWLSDINEYNKLKNKDDTLIDWINRFCK